MKIIYLGKYNSSEILTGPEKVAKRLFEHAKKDNEVIFIEYFFGEDHRNILKRLFGYQIIEDRVLRLGLIRLLLFLYKFKPDIIHIITFQRFTITAFLYKLFFNASYFYTVHGIIKYENSIKQNLSRLYLLKDYITEKIIFRFTDKLLFLSDKSVALVENYYNLKKEKIQIIQNGIDEVFYLQAKSDLYNDELKIVFVGDINRTEKEFGFFISALNKIKINLQIFVISDVQSTNINLLNINHLIKFINKMSTLEYARFLLDKDLIISTSSYEPFSISTAEGMTAGLIPIVTNAAGISIYVKNNYNGFVYESGDSEKLKNIIEELAEDPDRRKTLSANAREIYHLLNWERIAVHHLQLYKSS